MSLSNVTTNTIKRARPRSGLLEDATADTPFSVKRSRTSESIGDVSAGTDATTGRALALADLRPTSSAPLSTTECRECGHRLRKYLINRRACIFMCSNPSNECFFPLNVPTMDQFLRAFDFPEIPAAAVVSAASAPSDTPRQWPTLVTDKDAVLPDFDELSISEFAGMSDDAGSPVVSPRVAMATSQTLVTSSSLSGGGALVLSSMSAAGGNGNAPTSAAADDTPMPTAVANETSVSAASSSSSVTTGTTSVASVAELSAASTSPALPSASGSANTPLSATGAVARQNLERPPSPMTSRSAADPPSSMPAGAPMSTAPTTHTDIDSPASMPTGNAVAADIEEDFGGASPAMIASSLLRRLPSLNTDADAASSRTPIGGGGGAADGVFGVGRSLPPMPRVRSQSPFGGSIPPLMTPPTSASSTSSFEEDDVYGPIHDQITPMTRRSRVGGDKVFHSAQQHRSDGGLSGFVGDFSNSSKSVKSLSLKDHVPRVGSGVGSGVPAAGTDDPSKVSASTTSKHRSSSEATQKLANSVSPPVHPGSGVTSSITRQSKTAGTSANVLISQSSCDDSVSLPHATSTAALSDPPAEESASPQVSLPPAFSTPSTASPPTTAVASSSPKPAAGGDGTAAVADNANISADESQQSLSSTTSSSSQLLSLPPLPPPPTRSNRSAASAVSASPPSAAAVEACTMNSLGTSTGSAACSASANEIASSSVTTAAAFSSSSGPSGAGASSTCSTPPSTDPSGPSGSPPAQVLSAAPFSLPSQSSPKTLPSAVSLPPLPKPVLTLPPLPRPTLSSSSSPQVPATLPASSHRESHRETSTSSLAAPPSPHPQSQSSLALPPSPKPGPSPSHSPLILPPSPPQSHPLLTLPPSPQPEPSSPSPLPESFLALPPSPQAVDSDSDMKLDSDGLVSLDSFMPTLPSFGRAASNPSTLAPPPEPEVAPRNPFFRPARTFGNVLFMRNSSARNSANSSTTTTSATGHHKRLSVKEKSELLKKGSLSNALSSLGAPAGSMAALAQYPADPQKAKKLEALASKAKAAGNGGGKSVDEKGSEHVTGKKKKSAAKKKPAAASKKRTKKPAKPKAKKAPAKAKKKKPAATKPARSRKKAVQKKSKAKSAREAQQEEFERLARSDDVSDFAKALEMDLLADQEEF